MTLQSSLQSLHYLLGVYPRMDYELFVVWQEGCSPTCFRVADELAVTHLWRHLLAGYCSGTAAGDSSNFGVWGTSYLKLAPNFTFHISGSSAELSVL